MAITAKQQRIVFVAAAYGWVISTMDTSLFWSCLPDMATFFQVPEVHIHGSIYLTFFGTLLSCLFLGQISDLYGRKPVLFYAGVGFFLSTVICLLMHNYPLFLVGRFFQGVFAAAPYSLGAALLYDIHDKKNATIQVGYMASIYSLATAVGGPVGSAINEIWSWRANLWILAFASGGYVAFIFFLLPESNKLKGITSWSLKEFFKDQYAVMANLTLRKSILSMSAGLEILTIIFSWIPLIYVNHMGFSSATVAWGLFFVMSGMFLVRFSSGWVVTHFSAEKITLFSLCIGGVGLLMLGCSSFFLPTDFWPSIFSIFIYATIICGSLPGFNRLIFETWPEKSGTLGSMITFVRLVMGGLFLFFGTFLYNGTVFILFLYISLIFLVLCLYFIPFVLKKINH